MSKCVATDEHNRNVFHAAAALGQPKTIAKLLASYPKRLVSSALSSRDKRGLTPVQTAASYGHLRVLKSLLDAGADSSGLSEFLTRQSQSDSPYRTLHRSLVTCGGPERVPVGYADFERSNSTPQDNNWPVSIVDAAVSPTGHVAACIVQPVNTFERHVYFSTHMQPFAKIDVQTKAVAVVCSASHTMVVADDGVWTWGSPTFGLLGRECDSKKEEIHPGYVDGLVEFTEGGSGAYGALSGPIRGKPVEPLMGGATADDHCIAYSATKLWAWGVNTGQMLGRVAKGPVEEPILVADTQRKWGGRVLAADCGDGFSIVMLSNDIVVILQNDGWYRLDLHHKAVGVRARGKFACVETDHGRLLRFGPSFDQQPTRLWKPKRAGLDTITAWDLGVSGNAVVAAVSGTYLRNNQGTETTRLKGFDGILLRQVECDANLKVFAAVHEFESAEIGDFFGIDNEPLVKAPKEKTGITITVDDGEIEASKAVLLGRCPTLKDSVAAVPGSSIMIKHTSKGLRAENVQLDAMKDFLNHLYFNSELQEITSPSLQRLIRNNLGEGLYGSRQEFGDVTLIDRDGGHILVHSFVMAQLSPFFAARLSGRWPGKEIELNISREVIEAIVRFAYTGKIFDNGEGLSFVYEVWQASHQFIIGCLQERCEACVNEMIDFASVVGVFEAAPPASHLSKMMVSIIVEHMDYFIRDLGELEASMLEVIERAFVNAEGTEKPLTGMYELIEELSKRSKEPKESKDSKEHKDVKEPVKEVSPQAIASHAPSPPPSNPSTETVNSAKSGETWTAAARKKRGSKSAPQPSPSTPRAKLPVPPVAAQKSAPSHVPATPSQQPAPVNPGRSRSPHTTPAKATPLAPQALPTLGSSQLGTDQHRKERPRTSSSSHARPKLSQKERRRLKMMEDPFAEPESSQAPSSSPPASNPWRQVKPVSSQPILQQLEMRKVPKSWAWLS